MPEPIDGDVSGTSDDFQDDIFERNTDEWISSDEDNQEGEDDE